MSKKLQNSSISVFFPAYNDAKSIGKLVTDADDTLCGLTDDYEIIVVNDGSADETAEVLCELQKEYKTLRVVTHETNKGYGAALQSGFRAAEKDLIFYTDGDGQYDVRELNLLIEKLTDETDVVNGYKIRRADGKRRKYVGESYNKMAHFFFDLPIRDVDCDFRLIRKSALENVDLISTSGGICVELVYKLARKGCNFTEIAVNHYSRPFGKSQFFTFARIAKTIVDFFSLWLKLVVLQKVR
jgi:glycosyltransferase involved in cell wall biosynthesis